MKLSNKFYDISVDDANNQISFVPKEALLNNLDKESFERLIDCLGMAYEYIFEAEDT